MPLSKLSTDTDVGIGAYKTAKAIKTEKLLSKTPKSAPDYVLSHGKKFNKKLIIVEVKRNRDDMYRELELNYTFGELGISPKIWYVKVANVVPKEPGVAGAGGGGADVAGVTEIVGEQMSLRKFLRDYKAEDKPIVTSYLIEQMDCGKNILSYYKNAVPMFDDLRKFVKRIVALGYVNTDIKIGNLCIDPDTKQFMMIDLDHNRFVKLQPNITDKIYEDYMLFQIFISVIKLGVPLPIKFFFNRPDLVVMIDAMMKHFKGVDKNPEKPPTEKHLYTFIYHPVYNLFWYAGEKQINVGEYIYKSFTEPAIYNANNALNIIMANLFPNNPSLIVPNAPPTPPHMANPIANPIANPVANPMANPMANPIANPIATPVYNYIPTPAPPPPMANPDAGALDAGALVAGPHAPVYETPTMIVVPNQLNRGGKRNTKRKQQKRRKTYRKKRV